MIGNYLQMKRKIIVVFEFWRSTMPFRYNSILRIILGLIMPAVCLITTGKHASLAAAPEICYEVSSVQLFTAESDENS